METLASSDQPQRGVGHSNAEHGHKQRQRKPKPKSHKRDERKLPLAATPDQPSDAEQKAPVATVEPIQARPGSSTKKIKKDAGNSRVPKKAKLPPKQLEEGLKSGEFFRAKLCIDHVSAYVTVAFPLPSNVMHHARVNIAAASLGGARAGDDVACRFADSAQETVDAHGYAAVHANVVHVFKRHRQTPLAPPPTLPEGNLMNPTNQGSSSQAPPSQPSKAPKPPRSPKASDASAAATKDASAKTAKTPRQRGPRKAKSYFDDYISLEDVRSGLKNGGLVKGRIRINARNPGQSFVTVIHNEDDDIDDYLEISQKFASLSIRPVKPPPSADPSKKRLYDFKNDFGEDVDVFLDGQRARNRAMEGDLVVVRLTNKHRPASKGPNKKRAPPCSNDKDDNDDGGGAGDADANDHDEDNDEDAEIKVCESPEPKCVQPLGEVVYILEENRPQFLTGFFQACRSSDKATTFIPIDKRAPKALISRTEWPIQFAVDPSRGVPEKARRSEGRGKSNDSGGDKSKHQQKRPPKNKEPIQVSAESIEHQLVYSVRLKFWKVTDRLPWCTFERCLGPAGDISVETEALLTQCGVDYDHQGAFDACVTNCICEYDAKWVIPDSELTNRTDLRDTLIFSIDPITARDIDDTLSISRTPQGNYRIGVHIADVSYFVRPGTAIDEEAKRRSTSIYLVDKVIPMLPRVLCEHLCSLNYGVDRLAFSVFFTMTAAGDILEDSALPPEDQPWFGRTVIRSAGKLDYDTIQRVIDFKESCAAEKTDANVSLASIFPSGGVALDKLEQIAECCVMLNNAAKARRKQRFDNGALTLQRVKLQFRLDPSGNPISFYTYEQKDSNRLVEEFMLAANQLVARRLVVFCKDAALLRRQPPPLGKGMGNLLAACSKEGLAMDTTSSGGLHRSLLAMAHMRRPGCPVSMKELFENLATKPMQCAEYFCTGNVPVSEWAHYALNFDVYTHFTSPIRRYPDILVHRMLQFVVNQEHAQANKPIPQRRGIDDFVPIRQEISSMVKNCNMRKLNARKAQEQSDRVFLCLLLKDNPLLETAVVIDVGSRTFDLFIPRLGLEKRVWLEDLPIKAAIEEESGVLSVSWSSGARTYRLFDAIPISITSRRTPPIDIAISLADPTGPLPASAVVLTADAED